MTTPRLYKQITLTSYDESLRTREDLDLQDDGLWHASPFAMGLGALVTRKHAGLVQCLKLEGVFREHELDQYKNRRLPDGSVMLNLAIRAAIDRCTQLQSFTYTLSARPLITLYSGLAALQNLQLLHLQMPSTSTPQPQVTVPALPHLREFAFTEYDSTCYPDDLSLVFFHATKLESLTMHFSLRSRNALEPAPFLSMLHRNLAQKRAFKLRRLAIHNVCTSPSPEVNTLFSPDLLEDLTLINSFGHAHGSAKAIATHFIDASWAQIWDETRLSIEKMKVMRTDKINHLVVKDISIMPGLEKIYFVNKSKFTRNNKFGIQSPSPSRSSSSDGLTPIGPPIEVRTPIARGQASSPREILRDNLIETITRLHGPHLRHIILPARLPCNIYSLSRLGAGCPNLTQLAFAMEEVDPHALRQVGPLAKHLRYCRILAPDASGPEGVEMRRAWDEFEAREDHAYYFELELSGHWGNSPLDSKNLEYVGLGQKVFEVGSLSTEIKTIVDEDGDELEQKVYGRSVKQVKLQEVADIALWKMGSYDV